MLSSAWERLAPFLDVIGAVLIFASWVTSNTLSQRAQNQANMHQAIIDRVRHFRLYDDFSHRIIDIQSELAQTHDLVQDTTKGEMALEGKVDSLPDGPIWTGMTATQVWELNDFVNALEQYALKLSVSEGTHQSINTARTRSQELSKTFRSARDEYDLLVAEFNTNSPSADDVAAEKKLRKRIDRLWDTYDTAKQEMLHVGDYLLDRAAVRTDTANQHATKCKQLSYVMYVIGTLAILFGRTKSALAAKRKPVH